MNIKLLSGCLLLVTLAFSNCKKDDPTPPEDGTSMRILPGVGITEIKIGDPSQKAIDLYGTPFPSNGSANGTYYHFLIYVAAGVTVYCEPTSQPTFNAQLPIASLLFSGNFKGKTAEGIGIGSTKAEVKAAYGDPVSSSPNFGDEYTIGMSIIYDNNDLVNSIEVE